MKNQIKIESPIKPFKKQIEVSSDKSLSIRCLLLSSIALGKSKIYNLLESEDVINSLKAIKRLGISYKKIGKYYEICGYGINSYQTKKKLTIYFKKYMDILTNKMKTSAARIRNAGKKNRNERSTAAGLIRYQNLVSWLYW